MVSKDGLGVINWWGFSPALDLFEHGLIADRSEFDDINILLVGCGDSRHIIKTICSLKKIHNKRINFYIVESCIELYARHMLQTVVAALPLSQIGLQDKTELFLELFGNGLLRQQSADFVSKMSSDFIRLVTDPDLCRKMLPFFDFDNLKFKERDILESIFKMWRDRNPKTFDFSHCWDLRLRQNLGVRYDAIPNVFDWDCSITLHDRGAEIVNSREYIHWRHKGVAFQLRDANYDVSNRTLVSGRVLPTVNGDKTVRLGYWGDIVCSPYLAFGIKSNNQALFKKSNNQYTHGSSRVSEYNVNEIFHQLAYNKPYVEKIVTTAGPSITEIDEDTDENLTSSPSLDDLSLPADIKITFLPLNAMSDFLAKKEKFQNIFDLLYFSTSLVSHLESCKVLSNLMRSNAVTLVEIPKYIVSLSGDQVEGFKTRVDEMAQSVGLTKESHIDAAAATELERWGHVIYSVV